jgi:hypothetical protein
MSLALIHRYCLPNGPLRYSPRRRLTSSTEKNQKSKMKDMPPPLPPSRSSSTADNNKVFSSPVEAKRRYLESKKRTEDFLKDPQRKISQLQSEMDQVRDKLEREVYHKSVWRRLTDPLKRKQHSLINMIAATFAYILAYQLHLKRQANQKLQAQIDQQQLKVEDLQRLLRSLLDKEYIEDVSKEISDERQSNNRGNNSANRRTVWNGWTWTTSREQGQSSRATHECIGVDDDFSVITSILRKRLEERIGDEGLDDESKKQRNIERIWKENEKRLSPPSSKLSPLDNDDDAMKELYALASDDGIGGNENVLLEEVMAENLTSSGGSMKRKRVFDM